MSSSSGSAAGASASSAASTQLKVLTLYSDGACAGTPINVQVAVDAECSSDYSGSAGSCAAMTVSTATYYYTYTCATTDRQAAVEEQFGSQAFFGYDIFSDSACTDYSTSVVYLAVGTCQVGFSNESARASLDDDGSGELDVYWHNQDCSSDPSVFAMSAVNLSSGACFTYSNTDQGYVYFTSDSLEAAAASASASASEVSGSSASNGPSTTAAPTATATSAPISTTDSDSSGVSTGAVVGIIIACIVALLVLVFFVWRCRQKSKDKALAFNQDALLEDNYYRGKAGSAAATQPTTGPWMPAYSSGDAALWEDEAIISSRVPREKVITEALISRGGYGEVYKGTYNGDDVAIKMLLPETRRSLKHVNAFLAEVKMMAALEHTRIVQFVGVAWDSLNDLCVLSEYMAGGDLRALLSHYETSNHSQGFDYDKVKIALHIAHALTYLHSLPQPVIHRDLKSKNVLLTPELDAKLTDFGVSREREDRTMTAGVGTSLWMAPEVMMGEKYDTPADMFSFGVLLSELDLHSLPYSHAKENSNTGRKMPDAAILQMVAMGTLRVEFSASSSPDMVALGIACVSVNPKDRPTAAEALYRLQRILPELLMQRIDSI